MLLQIFWLYSLTNENILDSLKLKVFWKSWCTQQNADFLKPVGAMDIDQQILTRTDNFPGWISLTVAYLIRAAKNMMVMFWTKMAMLKY